MLATWNKIGYNTQVYAHNKRFATISTMRGNDYMSASDKKKLRKEQNAAAMTEKQLQAQKEAKKLKSYTLTFVVVMVLVVAIMVGIFVRTPIAGAISRGTHAVTIGNHQLSTADLSYYYVDAIVSHYNQYINNYGDYGAMYAQWMEGIDFSKPVGDQEHDKETGKTWAEYYIDTAIDTAKQVYALYDKAMADPDFKLSTSDQEYLDNFEDYVEMTASMNYYNSASGYLRGRYGDGANMKTYKTYSEVSLIASEYYNAHQESLDYKDADYRAYEKDKYNEYSSFTYALYEVTASKFLTGGTTTKDENGKETTTYSDEEKKAAEEAAKAAADALAVAENNTLEALNKAIKAMEINKKNTSAAATENKDTLYNSISNEDIRKWLSDDARKEGDMTVIEKSTTSTDADGKETKTVSGYYVVLFQGKNDNLMKLQNVRHILVQFKGGTEDKDTGKVVYSDTEKATAEKKAQELLAQFKKGEKQDAEAFGELAKKNSDDTGSASTGGLYEDIYPGQMVEPFEKWCFDESRKAGDTGVVETEYGFHVMYYVGADELTFRDYMIDADMTSEEMEKWNDSIVDPVTVTKVNVNGINADYKLG